MHSLTHSFIHALTHYSFPHCCCCCTQVMWIYEHLLVGRSDEEAAEHFRRELELSLNTRGTRINDAAHMLAHA